MEVEPLAKQSSYNKAIRVGANSIYLYKKSGHTESNGGQACTEERPREVVVKGGHVQAQQRDLRRNQTYQLLCLEFSASRTVKQ